MKKYICFLKSVNVGGHNKIKMIELREVLLKNGLKDVKTYIQSGNIVFQSDLEFQCLSNNISLSIKEKFNLDIKFILKEFNDFLEETKNHFYENLKLENKFLHIIFMNSKEELSSNEKILSKVITEKIHFTTKNIHIAYPEGSAKSKLNIKDIENAYSCLATSRNWNSILKLQTF